MRAPTQLAPALELSVVMPCLNEAETLGACIEKARTAIEEMGIAAEIVVADNGSTDGSREIAAAGGARVVTVASPGYGNALMGGIAASRGRLIVMGDADSSYDFLELPKFVRKLREGNDLVQGCRLKRGNGRILPGAMPRLHRWGNPLLSWLLRTWFRAPVSDVYCGLRGFTREHYDRLDLRCTGMEFATEMIIKSSLRPARIAEVPITLHPDGRSRKPHLRTFRDGWRTLRLYLLYCPRWLFMVPGLAMLCLGLVAYTVALPSFRVFGVGFAAHTLLFGSLAIICGYQAITFAVFTRAFGAMEGLIPNGGPPQAAGRRLHRRAGPGDRDAGDRRRRDPPAPRAERVAPARFRALELHDHHALGYSRCDLDCARIPDHALELLSHGAVPRQREPSERRQPGTQGRGGQDLGADRYAGGRRHQATAPCSRAFASAPSGTTGGARGMTLSPPWIGMRWRRAVVVTAAIGLLFLAWEAASAEAEGPIYSVPANPPPAAESVDFTNALNHRVRHLPTELNPPIAQTPAEVANRIQVLERGVVLERPRSKQRQAHPAPERRAPETLVVQAPGDRAPLTLAFVGAGVLATLGLLLSVRGKHRDPAPRT